MVGTSILEGHADARQRTHQTLRVRTTVCQGKVAGRSSSHFCRAASEVNGWEPKARTELPPLD